jgi:hypothetical protein
LQNFSNGLKQTNQLSFISLCKAVVIKEFAPSPYEKNSLSLKIGDEIDVIDMNETGIWTGVLNKKIGTFKFIHVYLLDTSRNNKVKTQSKRSIKTTENNCQKNNSRSRSFNYLNIIKTTNNLLPLYSSCVNIVNKFSTSNYLYRPSLTCRQSNLNNPSAINNTGEIRKKIVCYF